MATTATHTAHAAIRTTRAAHAAYAVRTVLLLLLLLLVVRSSCAARVPSGMSGRIEQSYSASSKIACCWSS
jgi:hypothetical protein